ncbi:glycosyltransferase family 2 protein [Candidatus Gottesmanbacteria bacterium]|nr:glycosyltransferase family 2 protein [Candidatus Gottesmanbacteria bacterium]
MISAVILTNNSAKYLEKCLSSLSFCSEKIVIDDESTDDTLKIAKDLGAIVFNRKLNGNFADQRNFGLTNATPPWVLFIDSDELVSKELSEEIKEAIKSNQYNGYFIPRLDIFDGKILKFGETGNIKLLRLAKKDVGRWERKIHETWHIKGPIGELKSPILHYPHPTVREFLSEINDYSTLHAQELRKEGKMANVFTIIFYPTLKFIQNYFLKFGFLDGVPGFIYAAMMSFHSFLSQTKLWQIQNPQPKI